MSFITKLLGIDEILRSIKEINSKLEVKFEKHTIDEMSYDKVSFISPLDNNPFLLIETNFDYCNEKDDMRKKHIGSADKLMSMLQYLPIVQNISQSKALEGAYKIVFPEGAVGKLMQYKNGMLGTPLVQASGKIGNTHAGLVPLGNMPISPVILFTALSVVTGQYFMAKINKSLESISKDLKDIKWMILDDKESKNKSIYSFLTYIRDNQELIMNNSELRAATLTNLQLYTVELIQNQLFYDKTLNRKIMELDRVVDNYKATSKRVNEVDNLKNEINNLLIQQNICLELYVVGKMYEMQIAQIYDDNYCNRLINELNEEVISSVEFNRKIANKFIFILDEVASRAVINNEKVHVLKKDVNLNVVDRQKSFERSVKATISSIEEIISLNKKEQVFIVEQGQLYYIDEEIA